jgi:hypothetical protein
MHHAGLLRHAISMRHIRQPNTYHSPAGLPLPPQSQQVPKARTFAIPTSTNIPKSDDRPPYPNTPIHTTLTPGEYTARKRQLPFVARCLVHRTSRKWRKCRYPHPRIRRPNIWSLRGARCPPSRTRHIRGIFRVFAVGLVPDNWSTGGFPFAISGRGRCSGRKSPWLCFGGGGFGVRCWVGKADRAIAGC